MTTKQIIPAPIKGLITQINATKPNFAVLDLPADPKFPTFTRTLTVNDMLAYSDTKEILFFFKIEFKNEKGEIMPIDTSTIGDWKVRSEDISDLVGADGKAIMVDEQMIDGIDGIETIISTIKAPIKVNTFSYMTWLLKNKKADLHSLISSYAMQRTTEGKFNL